MAYNYYCFSFTIANKTIKGDTYDDRRDSFLAAIRKHGPTYEDTTSYVLVRASDTTSYGDIQTSIFDSKYYILNDKFVCTSVDIDTFRKAGPADELEFTYK